MSQADANPNPDVSIVIPIYNEEGILRGSVLELREKLRQPGRAPASATLRVLYGVAGALALVAVGLALW